LSRWRAFHARHGDCDVLFRQADCPALEQEIAMQTTGNLPSSGTALVLTGPVSEQAEAPRLRSVRHVAQFLAHLIAMKHQAPQVRERRRAEPAEAIAAYRASAERVNAYAPQ
jgi:hypothetical protein